MSFFIVIVFYFLILSMVYLYKVFVVFFFGIGFGNDVMWVLLFVGLLNLMRIRGILLIEKVVFDVFFMKILFFLDWLFFVVMV